MKTLLLPACLLALTPNGPGPGPAERHPTADLVYGGNRAALFRRLRVRVVLAEQAPLLPGADLRAPRLVSREEIDPQGRVAREDAADDAAHLLRRRDFEYGPAATPVAHTDYQRAEAHPDIVRTPPAWLPVLHTRTVAEADQPAGTTRWNRTTGLWEPLDRIRNWTRHDTAYAETRTVADGRRTLLTRTYHTGPGKQIMRFDVLPFGPDGPAEPSFQYYRLAHGNPVESGTVNYDQALAAHLAAHPPKPGNDRPAAYATLADVARHAVGTYQPDGTATYNAQGQFLTMDIYGVTTSYQRDAQGRALSRRQAPKDGPGLITTYAYRPDGLLASETETQENGRPLEIRRYRYVFY